MPADEVDQYASDEPPAHAANRVAADVQAHGQANVLRVDLFAQVGHRHCRQAAQRQADQGAGGQYQLPAGHHCAGQGGQGGADQREHHHGFAPDAVRNGAGDQQAERQHGGGHRQHQAALCRVDGKLPGQQRHHRLYAVQQGEGGETAAEQGQHGFHEGGCAFFDPHFGQDGRFWLKEEGGYCSFHGRVPLAQ
ncbi:hypothetical protein D3C80_1176650 [compost metagenome]